MKIKKILKKVILASVLLMGVYFSYQFYYNLISNTGYIERTTKIDLPFWTSTIEAFDNGEFVVIGKYQMPIDEINIFSEKYNINKACDSSKYFLMFDDYLKVKNRPRYEDLKHCFFYSDCTKWNSWYILLNKFTGEIWIEFIYPDMSGDIVPCK
jgi:hypothetical protein